MKPRNVAMLCVATFLASGLAWQWTGPQEVITPKEPSCQLKVADAEEKAYAAIGRAWVSIIHEKLDGIEAELKAMRQAEPASATVFITEAKRGR